MKLFIFFVVICSSTVQGSDLNNYNDIANSLRTRVEGLIKSLSETRNSVYSKSRQLYTMDLNIKNEKSIAPVQKALDQKAGKNGVEICNKTFMNGLTNVLKDVRRLASVHLAIMAHRIDKSSDELQNVLKNLQAPALAQELEKCKAPTTCNLTGSYAISADNADIAIKDINSALILPSLNLRLDQQILSEIDNDIVKQTNACLAPL